ncbi:MAG TPA: Fmu (Sun) domain-containing protein [Panacibacter sp.]|nr:Fmu (Sun) domain-containing protein [Panacibacter sp.]
MEWLENWSPILSDRLIFICTKYPSFKVIDIFPFENELSETIDATVFAQSYLIQPSLFLRIRPGKKKTVTDKLLMHHIVYEEIAQDCFAITNTTKIDTIIELNKEAVIQDYSSQRIKEFLDPQIINYKSAMKVWDCCAASGGKSILVIDMPGKTDLTVSDIRPAILNNLKKRFKEAGIKKFNSFISDVTIKSYNIPYSPFDLIICDAPCSGSGTWGRTPEQLAYITTEKILEYAALQKKIIAGTIIHLNTEGYFLYITCSVFKKENEDAVKFICDNYNMKIIKQELLKGYNKKADTMFAALFTRNA